MKGILKSGFLIAICSVAIPKFAFAADDTDGRVQQEVIQYSDPTQSVSADNWRFQAGAELWYGAAPDNSLADIGYKGYGSGLSEGVSGSASRGDWTLLLAYRPGNFGETFTSSAANTVTYHTKEVTTEYEAKLRYLLSDENWLGFTPYILGGFHYLRDNTKDSYTLPAKYMQSNAVPQSTELRSYDSPEIGLGGMRSFGDNWGMRMDASVGRAFGNDQFQNTNANTPIVASSGQGVGYNTYLTVYYFLTDHVVINAGGRAAYVDATSHSVGGGPGFLYDYGVFTSIAYTFDSLSQD